MNGLPYYKAYPRDFIEGTIGMPFELKGAYRLVLDLIYMQGGRLPDDARYISGLLGCSIRKWNSLRDELVSIGKLVVIGEFLTNYRAEKELETLAKLQEKQSENASGPRKNKSLEKPRPNHTEPEPESITSSLRSDVPRTRLAKGERLPDDWQPKPAHFSLAATFGKDSAWVHTLADGMRDWAKANGHRQVGRKSDWDATFSNFIRRDGPRGRAPPGQRSSGWDAARDANLAEIEGRSNEPTFDNLDPLRPSGADFAGARSHDPAAARGRRSDGPPLLDLEPIRSDRR